MAASSTAAEPVFSTSTYSPVPSTVGSAIMEGLSLGYDTLFVLVIGHHQRLRRVVATYFISAPSRFLRLTTLAVSTPLSRVTPWNSTSCPVRYRPLMPVCGTMFMLGIASTFRP